MEIEAFEGREVSGDYGEEEDCELSLPVRKSKGYHEKTEESNEEDTVPEYEKDDD